MRERGAGWFRAGRRVVLVPSGRLVGVGVDGRIQQRERRSAGSALLHAAGGACRRLPVAWDYEVSSETEARLARYRGSERPIDAKRTDSSSSSGISRWLAAAAVFGPGGRAPVACA